MSPGFPFMASGKGSSGIKRQDKEHIAQLFQAYQQEEVEAGGGRMDLDLRSEYHTCVSVTH
jgi:hypothetical protein